MGGLKYDKDKPMWCLIPLKPLGLVAQVLTFGAKKYAPNSWQGVEPERYESAMWRHWAAIKNGEVLDDESGLPHIAHFLCNAIFITWFHIKQIEEAE